MHRAYARSHWENKAAGQCATIVGHGGALVEAITLNRRVVGSTPALAAM